MKFSSVTKVVALLCVYIITLVVPYIVGGDIRTDVKVDLAQEHQELLDKSELSEDEMARLMELTEREMNRLRNRVESTPFPNTSVRLQSLYIGAILWLFFSIVLRKTQYRDAIYVVILYGIALVMGYVLLIESIVYLLTFSIGVCIRNFYAKKFGIENS